MPKSIVSTSTSTSSPAAKGKTVRRGKEVDTCIADTLDAFSRTSLMELIELLEADPAKIFPTLAFARKPLDFSAKKAADDEEDEKFHSTYRKMYRIPKEVARPERHLLKPWARSRSCPGQCTPPRNEAGAH